MCTNPSTRRDTRSTTGNRDRRVRVASTSSAAGDTSSATVTTCAHGRSASRALRWLSASAPVIRACSSGSSRPSVRAWATSPASSSAVNTVFTASAASIRHNASSLRDAHFIATSNGLVATQNPYIGGPSHRTARSGPASVRFFGTISPTTVWAYTTSMSASTNATGWAARSTPNAWNSRASECASAGSAIAPKPSEHTVTPSCAPAIISGISPIARSAVRARREVPARGSTTVRRAAINENSAATKNALPSNSRMASNRVTAGSPAPARCGGGPPRRP